MNFDSNMKTLARFTREELEIIATSSVLYVQKMEPKFAATTFEQSSADILTAGRILKTFGPTLDYAESL